MAGKLTARAVDAIREPGRYGDGSGLWLHVGPTGGKSWVLRYKRHGRAREMGLGPVDLVPLAEAREKARQARRKLLDGIDPLDERAVEKRAAEVERARAVTFADAAEGFIAAQEAGWRNRKHRQQWRSTLRTYAEPVFGKLPVAEVDTDLVLRALEPIWTEKPETASRLRGRIEAVLDWAAARKLREGANPARWKGHLDTLLPARSKVAAVKHHKAVPWREVPDAMARIAGAGGIGAAALRFAVLTACRSVEVRGARWAEIDMDGREWMVPAERMKARKAHRVPLSDAAMAVLEEMRPLAGGGYGLVFPSTKPGRPTSDMTMAAVLKRLGIGATVHGFRSSFSDWAAETTNYPHEVREMALAHTVSNAVERAYRRGDLFERRRRLMEDWARYCAGAENRDVPLVSLSATRNGT
jgi:integrase